MTKIENYLAVVTLEEEERQKNTKLFPNSREGPAGSVLQPSDT